MSNAQRNPVSRNTKTFSFIYNKMHSEGINLKSNNYGKVKSVDFDVGDFSVHLAMHDVAEVFASEHGALDLHTSTARATKDNQATSPRPDSVTVFLWPSGCVCVCVCVYRP